MKCNDSIMKANGLANWLFRNTNANKPVVVYGRGEPYAGICLDACSKLLRKCYHIREDVAPCCLRGMLEELQEATVLATVSISEIACLWEEESLIDERMIELICDNERCGWIVSGAR